MIHSAPETDSYVSPGLGQSGYMSICMIPVVRMRPHRLLAGTRTAVGAAVADGAVSAVEIDQWACPAAHQPSRQRSGDPRHQISHRL